MQVRLARWQPYTKEYAPIYPTAYYLEGENYQSTKIIADSAQDFFQVRRENHSSLVDKG